MGPDFLTYEDTIELHAMQLERFGGSGGLRDEGLLRSALAMPQATFDGQYLHDGLFPMAAAYLSHIVKNHPFVDGNKRAGLVAALVFLDLNGHPIDQGHPGLYRLVMEVAEGKSGKDEIAEVLESLAAKPG